MQVLSLVGTWVSTIFFSLPFLSLLLKNSRDKIGGDQIISDKTVDRHVVPTAMYVGYNPRLPFPLFRLYYTVAFLPFSCN